MTTILTSLYMEQHMINAGMSKGRRWRGLCQIDNDYSSARVDESGTDNLFLGSSAGQNNIAGTTNTFIGRNSGFNGKGTLLSIWFRNKIKRWDIWNKRSFAKDIG